MTRSLILAIPILMSVFPAFGLGERIDFKGIEFLPSGEEYTGLNQRSRERRFTRKDNIILRYTLRDGKIRKIWDDDGLATLFVYHRDIASKVADGEMTLDSPLIQKDDALRKSFELLERIYEEL